MSKVIFDGECPICTSLKDVTENKLEHHEFQFIPFQSEEFEQNAPDLTVEQAEQALYVYTESGKRLRGARAVFEIMSEIPGAWGWIGRILRLPPFYWIAEPFYRLFARYRHGIRQSISD